MMTFLIAGIQTVALTLACAALFLGWRTFRTAPRACFLIVTAGLFIRLVAGEILFWVSYLHLPVGRSLQLGDGYWFFAIDGRAYIEWAAAAAHAGPMGILHLDKGLPAAAYLQVLATFIWLFGKSPAIGVLVNTACYLLTAAILVTLIRRDERLTTPGVIALAVLSLTPGSILWCLQPLKDPFSTLLIAAFVGCLVGWEEIWSRPRSSRDLIRLTAAVTAVLATIFYSVAGVRWYVAVSLWLALPLFLAAMFLRVPQRRGAALGAGLLLLPILALAILFGGFPYLRGVGDYILLKSNQSGTGVTRFAGGTVKWLDDNRDGYARTGGATTIGAGRLLQEHPAPPPVVKVAQAAPAKHVQRARPRPQHQIAAAEPAAKEQASDDPPSLTPDPVPTATQPEVPPPTPMPTTTVAATTPPPPSKALGRAESPSYAARAVSPPAPAVPTAAPTQAPVAAMTATAPPPPPPPQKKETAPEPKPQSVAPAPPPAGAPAPLPAPRKEPAHRPAASRRSEVVVAPKPEPVSPPKPAPKLTPKPVVHVVQTPPPAPPPPPVQPKSRMERLIAGITATFIPRTVAQAVGIISVGGGRGLWLVVETDTVAFDVTLLFVTFACFQLLRGRAASPALLAVIVSCIILTTGVVYAVTNFGTLFRLRDMIFTEICLLPLIAVQRPRESAPAQA